MSAILKSREPVLIANRGEIAIRIARTCKALGFPTVAIYSDADRFSEHVRACDQAFWVGGAAPKDSYLNVERVIEASRKAGARYVHPGYGFLSERPHFVEACEKAGLVFVGPSAESMRLMGDKIQARATVDALKVPRVPGSAGAVANAEEARKVAAQIGYPILLKATAGGGGKGMRRVDGDAELPSAFEGASREALGAFGDGSMYVEKLILEPHHVEIQVFGDGRGGAIHLGERECSIQRRHQKVWEESPAPILEQFPKTRPAMFEAAVRVASHVKYAGAGTFEFIVDGQGHFYFLEMNTRLQVEHPVTEWVTGVDLVAWQLLLAAGELKLPAIPERVGSAIEVRLYAEDPFTFLPAPGPLGEIRLPTGAFVRSDSAFSEAGEVSLNYDPMISKISVWGATRAEAVERLRAALDEARVQPPKRASGERVGSLRTNLSFLRRLARDARVIAGDTTTDLIAKTPALVEPFSTEPSLEAAIATSLFQILSENVGVLAGEGGTAPESVWAQRARLQSLRGGG
jgi:acetyl-CoA carboxylase biotin carboxylase subunit